MAYFVSSPRGFVLWFLVAFSDLEHENISKAITKTLQSKRSLIAAFAGPDSPPRIGLSNEVTKSPFVDENFLTRLLGLAPQGFDFGISGVQSEERLVL